MKELLVLRHARTEMAGTFCGQSDPPLNEAGQEQVRALLEQLAGEKFDGVWTSDLKRAKETAEPLARDAGVPLFEAPKLREIDFGEWEGLNWEQIEARDATFARRWIDEFPNLVSPGGEVFARFQTRVLDGFDELVAVESCTSGLLVTHAGAMRVILTQRCGRSDADAWSMTKDYCCSFRYAVEEEVRS